jgi:hypothetical protein
MTLHQIATPILGVLTAAFSFIAAYYWYLSSKQEPAEIQYTSASVSDNPEAHIGEAHAEIYALQKAYKDASALNKTASLWSALAALAAAFTAIIASIP